MRNQEVIKTISEMKNVIVDVSSKVDKTDIVNDLTLGGEDKVASAEVIKLLNSQLETIVHIVNNSMDTKKIQEVINRQGNIKFLQGVYTIDIVNQVGLSIPSNTHIFFDNVELNITAQSISNFKIIEIKDVENVTLTGIFTVKGDRDTHIGTTGEWGMGISILGSKNVTIENAVLKDNWGDGLYIGTGIKNFSENITTKNIVCDNNRRQGLSIISVKNYRSINDTFCNTNGTAPQCGVDIEPNANNEVLENIVFTSPNTYGNAKAGIMAYLTALDGTTNPINITINDHNDNGSAHGLHLQCAVNNVINGNITINNPTYKNSVNNAIITRSYEVNAPNCKIIKPVIINPNTFNSTSEKFGSAVFISRETTDMGSNKLGNIMIEELEIYANSANIPKSIYIQDSKSIGCDNIKIINPVKIIGKTKDKVTFGGRIVVEDRYNQLFEYNNYSETIGWSNYKRTISNRDFTSDRTLTLSSVSEIGTTHTFIVENPNLLLSVKPSTGAKISPLGGVDQILTCQSVGSSITVKKFNDTTWHITEMIGNWAVV